MGTISSNLGISSILSSIALSELCPCYKEFENNGAILGYLEEFMKNEMEKCCRNHGPDFGARGKAFCPESFEKIFIEAKRSMNKADGGKSGQDVLITDSYVIKQAAEHELASIDAVIARMAQRHGSEESLISPICRIIRVAQPGGTHPVTLTITLRMQIKNPLLFPESLFFDLKGNFGYSARDTSDKPGAKTKKDMDFWKRFPDGLHMTNLSLRDDMEKAMVRDTEMLNQLGIMDYSLLLHVVELCDNPIIQCPAQFTVRTPRSQPGKRFELGEYRKTCVKLDKLHGDRPVYLNDKKEFLYYYDAAWRIGKDIYSSGTDLFMESDARCPNARVAWRSRVGDQFTEVDLYLTPHHITLFDFRSKDTIEQANPHVPLAFATAMTKFGKKTYAIAYSLIDLFLHQNCRGTLNGLGKILTAADCRQDDIDPLDSSPYRARFLMMWNHRLNESCLATNSYYTYFPRTDELQAMEVCPEKNGVRSCKSLCKHLGLAGPEEPNGQCQAVKEMLDPCKGYLHRFEVGNFWSSSQRRLEDLLSKNIRAAQVSRFVNAIWSEINFMAPEKKMKYGECHVKLKQALIKFDESAGTVSDNRESCKIEDGVSSAS